MADPVKFEFARPTAPRVVNIEYLSPLVCAVAYAFVPGTGGGASGGVSEL